jgi:hypothetical protein
MSSGRTRRRRSRSESALPPSRSARNPEQLEAALERLMRDPRPSASSLKELIRRSSEFERGQGYAEPAKAVGQMQYVAGKLGVDALELQRIRDMIKDYGKKIGVYEAKAHREMKKQVKANTRRKKESAERRNANAKRRRNEAAAANARRRASVINVAPRSESPAVESEFNEEEAPPSKMPTGKFWAKPEFKNPPI